MNTKYFKFLGLAFISIGFCIGCSTPQRADVDTSPVSSSESDYDQPIAARSQESQMKTPSVSKKQSSKDEQKDKIPLIKYKGKIQELNPIVISDDGKRTILINTKLNSTNNLKVGDQIEISGHSMLSDEKYKNKKVRHADIIDVSVPKGYMRGLTDGAVPAIMNEELVRGWYWGEQKRAGTPDNWILNNKGTRGAKWVAPTK